MRIFLAAVVLGLAALPALARADQPPAILAQFPGGGGFVPGGPGPAPRFDPAPRTPTPDARPFGLPRPNTLPVPTDLRGLTIPEDGLRFVPPLDRPDIPALRIPSDPRRREAEPGTATGGIAGGGASDPRLGSWSGISAIVSASTLPAAVQARLLSERNLRFVETCQPAANELAAWRARQEGAGGAGLPLGAVLATLPEGSRRAAADLFARYGSACLRPIAGIAEPLVASFLAARVGAILQGDSVVCMATLVQPRFLLTARHCLSGPGGSRIDATGLVFSRHGAPRERVALSGRTVRSEYYERRPDLLFDSTELQSDFMLLELASPIADPAGARVALRIVAPARYDALQVLAFSLYLAEAARIRRVPGTWADHLRFDDSVPCMAVGRFGERVVLHACQTEAGASGAPLFSVAQGEIRLHGVHGGGFDRRASHPIVRRDTGVDTLAVPNFGATPDGEVARIASIPFGEARP
jgi:V8-like Glu-specific endopeptidase